MARRKSSLDDIKKAFERYDTDQNGYISYSEAHQVLHDELGFSPEHSKRLIKVYDRNGDGRLSYEEFIWFYWKIQEKKDHVLKMFRELDKDGSNSISFEEAMMALKDMDFTETEVRQLMHLHDNNKDGQLQFDEFVHFWEACGGKAPCKS